MADSAGVASRPVMIQVPVSITAIVTPEPEAGGYSVEVPALPGCYTEGESLEEVRTNLREAIEGWLNSAHDAAVRGKAP